MYHVTSSANRESIQEHGLDWSRTGLAVGIAGSPVPEQEGCFLAQDELEVSWFVHVNNTGGPVDVWEVSDVDAGELVRSGSCGWSGGECRHRTTGATLPRSVDIMCIIGVGP